MNSVKNGRTPSDDDRVARKRFKLESLDEYLDLPWTVDKRLLTPEATTMTDMHDMHFFPFDYFSLNEETNAVPHRLSCLETLPNELLLSILGYMPRIDLVSSFRGLNQRFDQLIFDEVRRLSLPRTTPVTWFMEHMKHIERAIETITLDPKLVPRAFSCTHSYPNLRTVILKNGPDFTLKLKVDDCSALGAIISCMDLLRAYSSWTDENGYIAPLFETDTVPNSTIFQMDIFLNTLPCPAIQQLSVTARDQGGLIYLCGRMPNLTDLRIKFCTRDYDDDDDGPIFSSSFSTSMSNAPSYLTKLHLDFYADRLSLNTLEWLFKSCQTHLKECTINADNCDYIDGAQLERLLKPCQQLVKLAFKIETESGDGDRSVNTSDILRQYRTDWWLDASRPPVFVERRSFGGIGILSLPDSSMESIKLSTNPRLWPLNKGPYDLPAVVFRKVTSIHLLDKYRMPISLDFVQLLEYMFPAAGQSLTCDYWEFASPQRIYECSNVGMVTLPQLSRVTKFFPSHSKGDKMTGVSLVLWLLIAPNIVELHIEKIPVDLKLRLAEELNQICGTDGSVSAVFNRIKDVWIFSPDGKIDEPKKIEIFLLFMETFPRAAIHPL